MKAVSNRSAIDRVIATNLKRLRERSGLKQHELAQMAETSEMRLCACEDGCECVDKDMMMRICQCLGVRFYEFFIEPDTPVLVDVDEKLFLEKCRIAKEKRVIEQVLSFLDFLNENKAEIMK